MWRSNRPPLQFGDDGPGEGGDAEQQKWALTVMWLRATSEHGAHLLENIALICCQPDFQTNQYLFKLQSPFPFAATLHSYRFP